MGYDLNVNIVQSKGMVNYSGMNLIIRKNYFDFIFISNTHDNHFDYMKIFDYFRSATQISLSKIYSEELKSYFGAELYRYLLDESISEGESCRYDIVPAYDMKF